MEVLETASLNCLGMNCLGMFLDWNTTYLALISSSTSALLQRHSSPRRLQPPSSALLLLNIAISDISTVPAPRPSRQNPAAPAIWPRRQQHLSNHQPHSCHGIPLRLPNSSSCSCCCCCCSCCCRRRGHLADCSQLGAAARAGRRRRELTGNLRKAQKRDGAEWMVILNVGPGDKGAEGDIAMYLSSILLKICWRKL
jgi:hypothetical protein